MQLMTEHDNEQIAIPIGAAMLHIPTRALIDTLMRAPAAAPPAAVATRFALPAIGSTWPGENAIYAGLVRGIDREPDYHLLVPNEPGEKTGVTWAKARDWATSLDLALPSRQEARILLANVPELFADEWYWLETQVAGNEDYACAQFFDGGTQNAYRKDFSFRARPVRRFPL